MGRYLEVACFIDKKAPDGNQVHIKKYLQEDYNMNTTSNSNEILTTIDYDMFRKISNRKITENPKLE